MRHLRRTKRAYAAKRQALLDCLQSYVGTDHVAAPGLAVLLKLPRGTSDVAVARRSVGVRHVSVAAFSLVCVA